MSNQAGSGDQMACQSGGAAVGEIAGRRGSEGQAQQRDESIRQFGAVILGTPESNSLVITDTQLQLYGLYLDSKRGLWFDSAGYPAGVL